MRRKRTAQSAFFYLRVAIRAALICLVRASVYANTITVTNTNDSGPGSLRQALMDANDGDTINFTVTGTIGLTSGELLVSKNITISGPGADSLAINGNATYRVFHVAPSNIVAISGVTITNGNANDQVLDGGGIYNDHATLTLGNCAVNNNVAFRDGGGVHNAGAATLTLSDCVITGNVTGNDGGGICNNGTGGAAIMGINNSTVSNNSATHGAGICNDGRMKGATLLQISNTTLSNNSAGYDAGAILNIANTKGTAILSNCTISGNSAPNYGGGINNAAALTITNSTFAFNSATSGGSIANGNPVTVSIGATVFQTGKVGENIYNCCSGTINSHGYNLSNDNGGGYLNGPGDQINTDPMLGPLRDNGGPTLTHALLSGSPAIDTGDPNFTPPPDYDQRGPGFDRVVNGRIDIGSFEVQAGTPSPTPTPTGCAVTSTACGSIFVGPAPTEFTVNLSESADPVTVQGSDFMVNATPANAAVLLNGNTTITFHFNTSPAVQGQNTMHIPAGAFDCGKGGVQEFTCTFFFEVPRPTPTPRARPSPAPRP